MKYFEIGQTVYHQGFGKGVVSAVINDGTFPVVVKFENNNTQTFTEDGKYSIAETSPTLSQNPIQPIVNTPINEFKQGELVWVSTTGTFWEVRFYSHFDGINHHAFEWQKNSGSTCLWERIRKFKDNPLI